MANADFGPTATWSVLSRRAELLRTVRGFFDRAGFLEVETPVLSCDTVVDRHLDPLLTVLPSDVRLPLVGTRMFLQTSPEFCMKRLLAAGAPAIYQICKVFRAGESGRMHNPEFTMVEWYRPGDGMTAGMKLLSDLAQAIFENGPAEVVSYRQAFEQHVGLDPHAAELKALIELAVSRCPGISTQSVGVDRDAWLDVLLTELVQPHLGQNVPTILYDYPSSQAALARVRQGPPPVAERFELYFQGIELANGYHELLDHAMLRERNAANNLLRQLDGKASLPEQSRLLAAMEQGLPASVGVALGLDRVLMLLVGAKSIADVLAFPAERA